MLGQIYARRAFTLYYQVMREFNDFGHSHIKCDYYGRESFSKFDIKESDELITRKGWVDSNLIVSEIKHYDFAFLPYFGDENNIVSSISFPSKMIVYATAGLPILYIGGKNSAPYKLINRYKIGVAIDIEDFKSSDINKILNHISNLKKSHEFQREIERVNKEMFSRQALIKSLQEVNLCELNHGLDNENLIGANNTIKDLWFLSTRSVENPIKNTIKYSKLYEKFMPQATFNRASSLNENTTTQIVNIILQEIRQDRLVYKIKDFGANNYTISQIINGKNPYHKINLGNLEGKNIIISLKDFNSHQKSLQQFNLDQVIFDINPIENAKQIVLKPTTISKKTLKVMINNDFSISDAYLLSLLGPNLALIVSPKILFLILQKAQNKINANKLDRSEFLYDILTTLKEYHIHDPFIYKVFKISLDNNLSNVSEESLFSIYKRYQKLRTVNNAVLLINPGVKKFLNFLKILGYSEEYIRKFLKNFIGMDASQVTLYFKRLPKDLTFRRNREL